MAHYTHAVDVIGVFQEKCYGHYFEYSFNDDDVDFINKEHYPHKVWVGGEGVCGMSGWRYAKVLKTVAYIIVDEDENGPVIEKWDLKNNRRYLITVD